MEEGLVIFGRKHTWQRQAIRCFLDVGLHLEDSTSIKYFHLYNDLMGKVVLCQETEAQRGSAASPRSPRELVTKSGLQHRQPARRTCTLNNRTTSSRSKVQKKAKSHETRKLNRNAVWCRLFPLFLSLKLLLSAAQAGNWVGALWGLRDGFGVKWSRTG